MPTPTILLIDGEPRTLQASLEPLARVGYRIAVARDGQAGIEAFRALRPSLVLLETTLEKKHGFEVCRELRREDPSGRVPIVMMGRPTAGATERIQALNSGANEFVPKSVDPATLIELCSGFLHRTAADATRAGASAGPRAAADNRAPFEPEAIGLTEQDILAHLDAILPSRTGAPAPERKPSEPPPPTGGHVARGPRPPRAEAAPRRDMARPTPTEPRKEHGKTPSAQKTAPKPAEPAPIPSGATSADAAKPRGVWLLLPAAGLVALAVIGTVILRAREGVRSGSEPPPPLSIERAAAAAAASDLVATRIASGSDSPAKEPAPSVPEAPAPSSLGRAEAGRAETARSKARPTASRVLPPENPSGERPSESAPPAGSQLEEAASDRAPEESALPTVAEEQLPTEKTSSSTSRASRSAVEEAPPASGEKVRVAAPLPTEGGPELSPAATESSPVVEAGRLVPLSEVDSPPVALVRGEIPYPVTAPKLRRPVELRLAVLVDETGRVSAVKPAGGEVAPEVVGEAVRAVRRWTYQPATAGGVPVKVWIVETVVFEPRP